MNSAVSGDAGVGRASRLRLEVRPGWQPAARCGIEEACREVLGPEVSFEVQEVAEIPLTAAGKHRGW